MYIDENEVPQVQKYLDDGTTIHTLIHLRPAKNPKQREMLAVTSSSLVKYSRHGQQEWINIVFLRHVTGMRLTIDRLRLGRLIAGIILLAFGLIFSIVAMIPTYTYSYWMEYWYYAYYYTWLLFPGIPILLVGLALLISAFTGRGGTLRIHSYNARDAFVDARFKLPMLGIVTKITKDLQRILALGGRGTPQEQPAGKSPTQLFPQPAAQPMPAQPASTPGLRIASDPVYPQYTAEPSTGQPEAQIDPDPQPREGTGGIKRCNTCGALIPSAQLFCQDCGSKQ